MNSSTIAGVSTPGERRLQPLPPETHWAARARFVGGGGFYLIAIAVALVNAIAAFVIIALIAVYYVLEHTPAAPAAPGSGDRSG